jgi:hypothetical protein
MAPRFAISVLLIWLFENEDDDEDEDECGSADEWELIPTDLPHLSLA